MLQTFLDLAFPKQRSCSCSATMAPKANKRKTLEITPEAPLEPWKSNVEYLSSVERAWYEILHHSVFEDLPHLTPLGQGNLPDEYKFPNIGGQAGFIPMAVFECTSSHSAVEVGCLRPISTKQADVSDLW